MTNGFESSGDIPATVSPWPEEAETAQQASSQLLSDEELQVIIDDRINTFAQTAPSDLQEYGLIIYAGAKLNGEIIRKLSGYQEVQSHEDYIVILQLAINRRYKQRLQETDDNERDFGQVVYNGVTSRARQYPDFVPQATAFFTEYYNSLKKSMHSWGRQNWVDLMLERHASATNVSPYDDMSTRVQKIFWGNIKERTKSISDHYGQQHYYDRAKTAIEKVNNSSEPAGTELLRYVFLPLTLEKSPVILKKVVDELDTTTPNQYFGLAPNQEKYFLYAADLFHRLTSEAAELGWHNAGILLQIWDDSNFRGTNGHNQVIHIGNRVTGSLNNLPEYSKPSTKLKNLNPLQPENTLESLDRCRKVLFELGQQPDVDPENFLLTLEIVKKLCQSAITEQFKTKKTKESDNQQAPDAIRDNDPRYWRRNRPGHGIIS